MQILIFDYKDKLNLGPIHELGPRRLQLKATLRNDPDGKGKEITGLYGS